MSPHTPSKTRWIYAASSLAGLVLLLVWLEGGFSSKVPPGTAQAAEAPPVRQGKIIKVSAADQPEIRVWPASVSARSVAEIGRASCRERV